jgi:hypothetical protein
VLLRESDEAAELARVSVINFRNSPRMSLCDGTYIQAREREPPPTRSFAELMIDCEEDRTYRAVLAGMLREIDR